MQLVLCVEAEEIGRTLSVISARYFLGRVDNVGIGKGETVRGLGAPVASIGVPEHSCRAVGEPLRAAARGAGSLFLRNGSGGPLHPHDAKSGIKVYMDV